MRYSEFWAPYLDRILDSASTIMIMGGVDTGKSTLCLNLLNHCLALGIKVALVDADVGQSDIGPPATVGLALLKEGRVERLEEAPVHTLYFVGSLSPEGAMLDVVMGTQYLVKIARKEGAQLIIIDTSGLVQGEVGKKLKWHKILATATDKVVALQRERELEHILRVVEALDGVRIERIKVEGIGRKDPFFRRRRREQRFKDYFRPSSIHKIKFDSISTLNTSFLSGTPLSSSFLEEVGKSVEEIVLHAERRDGGLYLILEETPSPSSLFRLRSFARGGVLYQTKDQILGTLLGLLNKDGGLLAVGVLEDVDFAQSLLHVRAPKETCFEEVAIINFGSAKFDFSASV